VIYYYILIHKYKKYDAKGKGEFIALKGSINLQDAFLNQVRKEKTNITVFLVNGFQIKGYVKGFDNYIIILEGDNKQNMIYKHAVSTIIPSKNVFISSDTFKDIED